METMNLFQQYLAQEFAEDYQEGRLSRRDALKLIGSVTRSLSLAEGFLAGCAPPEAGPGPASATAFAAPLASETSSPPAAGSVAPDDAAILAGPVDFAGDGEDVHAFLARPKGEGPFAVVLVCHENRGLTDHIRDVARRLAKAGYVALAVDLLSRLGGTDAVGSEHVPGVLAGIDPDQFVQDFLSGWRHLSTQPFADAARVGMVGFCFGGGVTWWVATRMPELKAAVPFYGPHPPPEAVADIQAAVLAIYAGRDQRINQGIPAIEAAMRQHGKTYEKVIYPETDHAFHNDTGSRYNPEAAQDAWRRTLDWFARYLGAP